MELTDWRSYINVRKIKLRSIRVPASGQEDNRSVDWAPTNGRPTVIFFANFNERQVIAATSCRPIVSKLCRKTVPSLHMKDSCSRRTLPWILQHNCYSVLMQTNRLCPFCQGCAADSPIDKKMNCCPIKAEPADIVRWAEGGLLMQQVALWKMIMHSNRQSERARKRESERERKSREIQRGLMSVH